MMSRRSCCPWRPLWFRSSVYWPPYRTTRNNFVLLLLKLLKHFTTCKAGTRFPGVVPFFFWWFSGEVEHIVHLIHLNLNSRLSHVAWFDHGPLWGNNARLCKLAVNWIPLITFLFHCRHQLVPHSVPNSSPVPLGNVLWGSGVCSVFVRSVSPCRLVLEVRLFPSPLRCSGLGPSFVSAFLFLLPFRVYPVPAGCVCVCAVHLGTYQTQLVAIIVIWQLVVFVKLLVSLASE